MRLAIIGGGSWGTALAIVLAPRFESVRLWLHENDLAARLQQTRENEVFLPGFLLPANVAAGTALEWAIEDAGMVLGVMPSRHARTLYSEMAEFLKPEIPIVSATKGIERASLLRMTEVIAEVFEPRFEPSVAVLSGPTFAREVAAGEPAAVVVAAANPVLARQIQTAFSGPTLRLYANSDPIGVELAASLKNVIAIGAGVSRGLGLGTNALAALVTRGLAEITRLAVAMGGQPRTLAGLAGLGDLVLTCSGDLSRNRQVGMQLASGRTLREILDSMNMVAEGIETCEAAVALGAKFAVDLPIIEQMYALLYGSKSPRDAIRALMERDLKDE
jgi:glycerol-3-phosphate dehydrogenase (NAD(P)+)